MMGKSSVSLIECCHFFRKMSEKGQKVHLFQKPENAIMAQCLSLLLSDNPQSHEEMRKIFEQALTEKDKVIKQKNGGK